MSAIAAVEAEEISENMEAPSCWICFEEQGDDEQPLVRDCSCRGGSGYAHLSCLVKYASEKSRKVIHPDEGDFTEAWRECPNCNQSYVNELSAKMVNESVVFAEKNYPGSQWRLVLALLLKSAPARGDEAAKITHRIIGLIKEMKSDNMFPPSMRMIEAMSYERLGRLLLEEDPDEGNSEEAKLEEAAQCRITAITWMKKAQDAYTEMGFDEAAEGARRLIKHIESNGEEENVDEDSDSSSEIQYYKDLYNKAVTKSGEDSSAALFTGTQLYHALRNERKGFEAERLLRKIVKQSHRIHGPEHKETKNLEVLLQRQKLRMVAAVHEEYGMQMFELLRYDCNMEKCVIKGPVWDATLGTREGEETLTVGADEIYLGLSHPVVCHFTDAPASDTKKKQMSMKSIAKSFLSFRKKQQPIGADDADCVKGKIGQVISWDKKADCYTVKFEDESLEPVIVRRVDVRVVFDLDKYNRDK